MSFCPLCQTTNEHILYSNDVLRIIHTNENPLIPGFCRVIWNKHIAEMSDLSEAEQQVLWHWVTKLELAMRQILQPKKINLASFGTMVPHLHWHVIARFENDAYYPASIWSNQHHQNPQQLPENWLEDVCKLLNQSHEERNQ